VILRSSALEGEWKQFYNLLRLLQALSLSKQGLFPKYLVINHRKLSPALPPLPQVDYFWFWCVAFLQLAKVVIPVYLTNRGV
jgi:hypothetical protein